MAGPLGNGAEGGPGGGKKGGGVPKGVQVGEMGGGGGGWGWRGHSSSRIVLFHVFQNHSGSFIQFQFDGIKVAVPFEGIITRTHFGTASLQSFWR